MYTKISSYNLFNNLLPGTLLALFLSKIEIIQFDEVNPIVAAFAFYFLGLLVSRVGSIIVEPAFKKLKIAKYTDYRDYLNATASDPKIEVLLETNNTYRTMVALIAIIAILAVHRKVTSYISVSADVQVTVLLLVVSAIFVLSYRKQTEFIRKRVEHIVEKKCAETTLQQRK